MDNSPLGRILYSTFRRISSKFEVVSHVNLAIIVNFLDNSAACIISWNVHFKNHNV